MFKQIICNFFIFSLLCGCTATRTNHQEASGEYLTPQGWIAPARFLEHASFDDYAASIKEEVDQHRIPFNAANAMQEAAMASPVQLPPGDHCDGNVEGIAILVHGLSDTAYAMRDVATVLTDACYISRTVLLPGHGTRAGDMLNARYEHWKNTLGYLIDQASTETETILLAGFSLGAVLTLEQAIHRNELVDGIIALSPAYNLSSYNKAKWSKWLRPIVPWIDRGVADDAMRYEAMPTRGVIETVQAIAQMNNQLHKHGPITIPWLLAQSVDDAVIVPESNQRLWQQHAIHPESRAIRFFSTQALEFENKVIDLSGKDLSQKVLGLSHIAILNSPENVHYGRNGDYRNCGLTAPRDRELVRRCEASSDVWYGIWSSDSKIETPLAISTFNPSFEKFATELRMFAGKVADIARQESR